MGHDLEPFVNSSDARGLRLPLPPLFAQRLARTIIGITLGLILLLQVAFIVRCGNGLAPLADPYSEANALRSADAYRTHGFRAHYGLPRICYGDLFPEY